MIGVPWASALFVLACLVCLQACGGGNNATPYGGPVARPLAVTTAALGDVITLDGSTSDPAPGAVSHYDWFVVSPQGRQVALFNANGPSPWFVADAAGAYQVQLRVVVDSPYFSGASPAANITVQIGPRVALSAEELRTRLRILAAAASPMLPPDGTSPTVTPGSNGGASAIVGSKLVAWDTPVFSYSGDMQVAGAIYPNSLFGSNQAVSYSATTFSGNYLTIDFDTDADSLEVMLKGLVYNSRLRVVVDGRLANATPVEYPNDGGVYLTQVRFAGKALRHIRLLMNAPYFGGVRIGAGDAIARHTFSPRVRAMFLGDSLTEGPAGQAALTSFAPRAAELLGWNDAWLSGVGATGYLTAPAPKLTFRQRYAADVKPYAPEVLVIAGGINDLAFSDGAIKAEATLLFDQIQADLPNALVFVAGPLASADRLRPGINLALKAAVGSRINFYWVPNMDERWITGTGNAGRPAGDGNADIVVSADTMHPTPAGIEFIATKLAEFIRLTVR